METPPHQRDRGPLTVEAVEWLAERNMSLNQARFTAEEDERIKANCRRVCEEEGLEEEELPGILGIGGAKERPPGYMARAKEMGEWRTEHRFIARICLGLPFRTGAAVYARARKLYDSSLSLRPEPHKAGGQKGPREQRTLPGWDLDWQNRLLASVQSHQFQETPWATAADCVKRLRLADINWPAVTKDLKDCERSQAALRGRFARLQRHYTASQPFEQEAIVEGNLPNLKRKRRRKAADPADGSSYLASPQWKPYSMRDTGLSQISLLLFLTSITHNKSRIWNYGMG